ncbi:MAG: hypothetical protein JWL68_5380 [Actinomycetia bacterium]|nr:hypothetical protein [Actinomycetes bacterium]
MTQYLLSVHAGGDGGAQPAEPMTPEQMQTSYQQVLALEEEMKAAGAWLFSGRLTEPDIATVVRVSAGEALTTDGPFVESKEHLAGFYIVEADDLDAALGWAARTSAIIGAPIEVRPFWDTKQA